MKAIMLHCKKYKAKIGKWENKSTAVPVESVKQKKQSEKNCIVALITVEKGDNSKRCAEYLDREITTFAKEVKVKNVAILPFPHLSDNVADSKTGLKFFEYLEQELVYQFKVTRGHYGSDKALLLKIEGHKENARFREFQ
jgi:hypothetical protein